jgi:hypothetical protein
VAGKEPPAGAVLMADDISPDEIVSGSGANREENGTLLHASDAKVIPLRDAR